MSRKTPVIPLVATFFGIMAALYLLQTVTPANKILGLRRDGFQDATATPAPAEDMAGWQVAILVIGVILVLAATLQGGMVFGFI